jgi:ribonuclease VapC
VVLDTSALLAILLREPEHDHFSAILASARDPLISAATLLEASIVMRTKTGADGVTALDDLLAAASVRCVAVDQTQALTARDAHAQYGKGNSAAALNFGDCFAYALARGYAQPLLFKGDDFAQTDVMVANHPGRDAVDKPA